MSNMREFRGDTYRPGGDRDRDRDQDSRRAESDFSFRSRDQIRVPPLPRGAGASVYRPSNDRPNSRGADSGDSYRPSSTQSYLQSNSQEPPSTGGRSDPSQATRNKSRRNRGSKRERDARRNQMPVNENIRQGQNEQNKFAPINGAPTGPNGNMNHSLPPRPPFRRPPYRPRNFYNPTPLASLVREKTPEYFAADQSKPGQGKFKTSSSSDEETSEMDMDTDTDAANQPPKKIRLEKDVVESHENFTAPKWSNPDIYTSTADQVATESSQKGFNLIKTIRKARVEQEQTKEANAVTDNNDFLSLDMGSIDISPKQHIPKGPKSSQVVVDLTGNTPTKPKGHPKPVLKAKNVLRDREDIDSALGSRKRTHDDEIKSTPAQRAKRPPKLHLILQGSILPGWRPANEKMATPWFKAGNDTSIPSARSLATEILDFHNFVRPKDFEDVIRNDLITRTEQTLIAKCRVSRGARLRPFGSFAAGLYLPNGDMDLVLHGEYFQRTGRPDLCQRRKELWALYGDLQRANIARPGSLVCIATAKVPIIKFVDYRTGLSVDLSFDSSTGTDVVEMYHHWQRQYPALPILASVIKQFLMMRSLNDVATGGLGGYSVICLVVSFLQHCPPERHEQHGELLLEFLDFYGNKFDRTANYISLDPPGYFPKVCS
jgi:non-canonical poly(A) RNA polymerase PAPD5/7